MLEPLSTFNPIFPQTFTVVRDGCAELPQSFDGGETWRPQRKVPRIVAVACKRTDGRNTQKARLDCNQMS